MLDAAGGERFEEAAQLRDAMRTVQTLHDRQQKMATAELGHRDVFGVKIGPAGAVVQVFQVRSGRVVERIELGPAAGAIGDRRRRATARCSRPRCSSSTSCAARRPKCTCRPSPTTARRSRPGSRTRRPAGPHRRAATRREARAGRSGQPQRRARLPEPLQPGDCRAVRGARDAARVLALPALPRRIECFDISTIQGSETVASMVVCEDGRMRRASIGSIRITGSG